MEKDALDLDETYKNWKKSLKAWKNENVSSKGTKI